MSREKSSLDKSATRVSSWWCVVKATFRRDLWVDGSYRANWIFRVLSLAFCCASLFFLGQTVGHNAETLAPYGGDYFGFALLGTAFAWIMGTALSATSKGLRELQLLGMLQPLFASPASPLATTFALSLYPLTSSFLQAALYLTLGTSLFGATLQSESLSLTLAALFLGILSHLALGVLSAAFVLTLRKSDPIAWLIQSLTFLFSGVAYPMEVLPPALQKAALLLPATHALKLLRASSSGEAIDFGGSLLTLGLFSALLWPLAAWVLHLSLKKALRDGSLDLP